MTAYYQGCHVHFDVEGELEDVRLDSLEEYRACNADETVPEDLLTAMVVENRVLERIRQDPALARKLFADQYEPDPDRYRR